MLILLEEILMILLGPHVRMGVDSLLFFVLFCFFFFFTMYFVYNLHINHNNNDNGFSSNVSTSP